MTLANEVIELVAKKISLTIDELIEKIGNEPLNILRLVKIVDHLYSLDETLRPDHLLEILSFPIVDSKDCTKETTLFDYAKETLSEGWKDTVKTTCLDWEWSNVECHHCKQSRVSWSWENMSESRCRFSCTCGLSAPWAPTPTEAFVLWQRLSI